MRKGSKMGNDLPLPPDAFAKPFETPSKMFLSTVSGVIGKQSKQYQAITISYRGQDYDTTPDPVFLSTLDAVETELLAEELSTSGKLIVTAYFDADPREDLTEFTHTKYFEFEVPQKPCSDFLVKAEDTGFLVLIINTDLYTYKALVNTDTSVIVESNVEYRTLN